MTQASTTTITRYIYDNEDILLEFNGANVLQARYTHGRGIDEPLIMLRGGQSFFYHADGLGSIWDLTDSAGTVARSYTYDSFGQLLAETGTVANPYTYTGREFDPETGLYYYRARYYAPRLGRFLQEDLVGFVGGDPNLYVYVRNNPVNFTDPEGLVAPAAPAIAACLASPPCAAGLAALTVGTAIAIQNIAMATAEDVKGILENIARKRDEFVATVVQPDTPEKICRPPTDPGDFLRLCFAFCKDRFRNNFFKRQLCRIACIGAVLGG